MARGTAGSIMGRLRHATGGPAEDHQLPPALTISISAEFCFTPISASIFRFRWMKSQLCGTFPRTDLLIEVSLGGLVELCGRVLAYHLIYKVLGSSFL